MKILNNKQVKKLLISSIIIILIGIIFIIVISKKQSKNHKNDINNAIASIIGVIKERYPEANEEEIIKSIKKDEYQGEGYKILNKYGIDEEVYAISNLKKYEKRVLVSNVLIVLLVSSLIIINIILYLRYRHEKLQELAKYIQRIINKDYSLDINENSEDELNNLKNELYKVTIMLKEEAENSEKQRESLANSVSDISHQLKTPLTSIMILLDNLNESKNMDIDTKNKFISEIDKQIEGMNWLVISLLKLSRLDAGVVSFSKKPISLNKIVQDILSNLEILSELKNVKFEVNAEEEININGDYNWNKEAIQNIIKNAIEHTKEDSKITISIKENSIYAELRIKDEGTGISKKDIKHIFERFYKAENSSENSIGIGLAISKTIIEQQNGYISVETSPNEGSTFIVKYIK